MAIGSMPANGSSSSRNLRRDDERPRDFGAAALAARQRIGRRRRERCQVELGEQLLAARTAPGGIEIERLENRHDVLLDRQAAEDRGLLRQVTDALARARVHRQIGDIFAVEDDAPRVGRRQPDRHVERRRLAGAVGPEQPDDFTRLHLEADAADNRAAAVRFREICRCEASPFSVWWRWRAGGVGGGLRSRLDRPPSS